MSTDVAVNPQAVQLIAQALASGLTHPGDDKTGPIVLPLPMFRTSSIPPEQAAYFAQEAGLPHADIAKLTAEAIVHTLSVGNVEMVNGTELTRLRALDAAAEADRKREVAIDCHCGATLVRSAMTEVNSGKFQVPGGKFISALQQVHPECALGHRPPEVGE